MNFAFATMNYGEVMKGREYKILEEGYDYTLLRVRGKPLHVPLHVFSKDNLAYSEQENMEEITV